MAGSEEGDDVMAMELDGDFFIDDKKGKVSVIKPSKKNKKKEINN